MVSGIKKMDTLSLALAIHNSPLQDWCPASVAMKKESLFHGMLFNKFAGLFLL
jgi:hypothetical protein